MTICLCCWSNGSGKYRISRFRSFPATRHTITATWCGCTTCGRILYSALDAVTLELFDRTRGCDLDSPHKRGEYWRPLETAEEIYGAEKFDAPLTRAADETRQEIQEVAQNIRGMGNHNHMFALFPKCGSLMED